MKEGELLLVLRDESLAGGKLVALLGDQLQQVRDALLLLLNLRMSSSYDIE